MVLADLDALLAALRTRAEEHKYTPTIGRSHGIHAEPVTFGLKLAQAYAEFDRCRSRLDRSAGRNRHLRDQRRGWNVCQCRSGKSKITWPNS
jgi:adenylosuccinate lyase